MAPHRYRVPYGNEGSARKFAFRCGTCGFVVGTKANGQIGGTAADARTRAARRQAHAAFDKLWLNVRFVPEYFDKICACRRGKGKLIKRMVSAHRRHCYDWLAEKLGIEREECHIGNFNLGQCKNVIAVCQGVTDLDIINWHRGKKRK